MRYRGVYRSLSPLAAQQGPKVASARPAVEPVSGATKALRNVYSASLR